MCLSDRELIWYMWDLSSVLNTVKNIDIRLEGNVWGKKVDPKERNLGDSV